MCGSRLGAGFLLPGRRRRRRGVASSVVPYRVCGFLSHPTGKLFLWALLAVGFKLFHLFLARRIRRRSPLEETDRGVAERLRAELLVWEGPVNSYLFNTS